MFPTILRIGPIAIRSYGLMMMIGFLLALWTAARRAEKSGADATFIVNLGLLSLISGIIGARVFYVIHYLDDFLDSPSPIWSVLNLTAGGLEFYGGLFAAIVCVIVYLLAKRKPIRWYLDILAPSIMLGLAFGRIGCFLNGCCWGKVSSLPFAVRFPYASFAFIQHWQEGRIKVPEELLLKGPSGKRYVIDRELIVLSDKELQERLKRVDPNSLEGIELNMLYQHLKQYNLTMEKLRMLIREYDLRSLPVHPTQLYSSVVAFCISLFLSWFYWRRRWDGQVILVLLLIYPVARFLIEMIRADNPHDVLGLTVSQAISVIAFIFAALGLVIFPRCFKMGVAENTFQKGSDD